MRSLILSIAALLSSLCLYAVPPVPRAADFSVVCDSLTARCNRRFGVQSMVSLEKVKLNNGALDLYFGRSLSDYPWHKEDILWFLRELNYESSEILGEYSVASCRVSGCRLEELETPYLSRDGSSPDYSLTARRAPARPLVRRLGAREFTNGLRGRHIVLWQSHGLYYNESQDEWRWQRATLHRTVEDLYTQSYVLQGVIPMLENAGAYVMTPRERDVQRREIICDNDPGFVPQGDGLLRTRGAYSEKGLWSEADVPGFADLKQEYAISDNPFRMGSARVARCSVTPASIARWTPEISQRGEYAVYVSYASFPSSCQNAHYTLHHLGGTTEFLVDQRKGGGTWIYLGTFEFAAGNQAYLELDNKGKGGEVVSADAVRFGGGMGKIARGGRVSGMPAFAEGSSYWIPWAGADSTLRKWESDYTNDYATRGAWARMMMEEKGIPFDCSLAFHTDSGSTPNDSIVGTLAIYTLRDDEGRKFADGTDRMTARTYADFVQTQIVEDLRSEFEPRWSRRQLWDRSYSESRTTGVPALLLELLSHQNFADMKYGLDPSFRFTVSRAVYKGILKYLACRYAVNYVVQPLPVNSFSAVLVGEHQVHLQWKPTTDKLEATAAPAGYTLFTRVDDGAFDDGVPVMYPDVTISIKPGHIYTWKVCAWNDGGVSFPSELLSAGIPLESSPEDAVLVVNNFDRVAAPAWVDTPNYAGFETLFDPGMPYVRDINYIGENYEFRRGISWDSDDGPGFGASYSDWAANEVAGNSFDYPSVHGASLMRLGRRFCSMSRDAFTADTSLISAFKHLDLICGAQLTTKIGSGAYPERYSVFPDRLQTALRKWTSAGGNILVSGSRIATDIWATVYDYKPDSLSVVRGKEFVKDILGYRWASSHGTNKGTIGGMPFYDSFNSECYAVPNTDGIKPGHAGATLWMRYDGSKVPAAVRYKAKTHRALALGVPVECLKNESDRDRVFREALEFFK